MTLKRTFMAALLLSLPLSVFAGGAADAPPVAPSAQESVVDALMNGTAHTHLRFRLESVDDNLVPSEKAEASTLRAVLGWETTIYL